MLSTLGVLYWKNKQYDQTVAECRRALIFDFTDYYSVLGIMQLYAREQRWGDMVEILETIRQHSTEENNLGEMLEEFAESAYFHSFISKLFRETERTDLLDTMYEATIIRLERSEQQYAQLCHVRYAYGEAFYGLPNRRAEAIKHWEQAIQQDLPRGNNPHLLPDLMQIPDSISETASFVGPQIYLARYWYTQGDLGQAKRMTRETVQQALGLLCDEDEENDAFALQRLLSVFVPLR
ncbi:hypothetical protein BDW59DRAFT_158496 [Aspergillus cavernicola]|uniref:Uncharacterized protein n=1 Tax=Aspergillus cavernicola TaxID=176166 RepID=A0ABR4IS38_9EURO